MIALKESLSATRPTSKSEISQIATRLLRKAEAIGVLPTPVDDVIAAARIGSTISLDEFSECFLLSLKQNVQGIFRGLLQKIRGAADLRKRAIYVRQNDRLPRIRFTKLHELGHQEIPWHKVDPAYTDDELTLSSDAQEEFEKEANFFASELMFQGARFRELALDYTPSFEAVFEIASIHGASNQATIWRYIEEHDEVIAVAQYYPTNAFDEYGRSVLRLWKIVASPKFLEKYADICLPLRIRCGDPWVEARDRQDIGKGRDVFLCGQHKVSFDWHTWWNKYTLFVLLRRRPSLGIIGRVLR